MGSKEKFRYIINYNLEKYDISVEVECIAESEKQAIRIFDENIGKVVSKIKLVEQVGNESSIGIVGIKELS